MHKNLLSIVWKVIKMQPFYIICHDCEHGNLENLELLFQLILPHKSDNIIIATEK